MSFAGSALLIKSVICSIETHRCNHFLLPSAVHENIQLLLTRFLWKGNIIHKRGAKVAWDTIFLPITNGGLDIKNMVHWNKAQILYHLIRVVVKSETLRASWVNKTMLKNKLFWTMKIPTDCSWIWKKVLKLREVALQFVSYSIASGNTISLWFDLWSNNTCRADSNTSPIIYQCGLTPTTKLSHIICNGTWHLPRPNSRHHHLNPLLDRCLNSFDFPSINTAGCDTILWNNVNVLKIKTWDIWDCIRHRKEHVGWYAAVWNKLRIN